MRHKKKIKSKQEALDIFERVAAAVEPREDLSVSQYADRYRILPRGASFESGPWRTDRFPFLREIMDSFTWKLKSKQRVVMKGSQVGVTEVLLNYMFYKVEHKPGPILYIQKTLDAIDRFLMQRFNKSMAAMPTVKKLLKRKRKAGGGSTKKLKTYPGGVLVFGGANSAPSLRSMPIEAFLIDEEDSYDADVQEEGSTIKVAVVRTRNYPYGIVARVSTPKIKETSTIEPAFLEGDQRYYEVPCPFCYELDWIRWSRLKYENDDPDTVRLVCEKCGMLIEERYKVWMFAEENGAKWVPHNPGASYPSWFLPAFYSPLGFFSWSDIVSDWLEAEKDFSDLKRQVVINTIFGETYSKKGKMIRSGWLEERKEDYRAEVPSGGLIVAEGFDVQENRIEGEVIAWGRSEENWSIDYPVFTGDTALPQVWMELEEYITKRVFRHESGQIMWPAIVAIDSGHRAEQVYQFCRKLEARRVFPVKGDDGWGKGFIDRPLKRNKAGVFLYRAWVDEIKSKVYSQLQIEEPGPGFCHFPKKPVYDKNYFNMLTAEQLVTVTTGFKRKLKWELSPGKRNEALDARCYAIAALNILGPTLQAVESGHALFGNNMSGRVPIRKKNRRVHSRGIQ